jgi:hypothetical protein
MIEMPLRGVVGVEKLGSEVRLQNKRKPNFSKHQPLDLHQKSEV